MDSLKCLQCGGELRRTRRKLFERFGYAKAYRCKNCDSRVRVGVASHSKKLKFAACPKCHTYELTAPRRVDKIDKMIKGPRSFLQRIMGGTLYHCWYCRLQFYDLRPRKKSERRMLSAPKDASDASAES
jgi:DNA-directed RNA polymerase subunit RPC12/RpoP